MQASVPMSGFVVKSAPSILGSVMSWIASVVSIIPVAGAAASVGAGRQPPEGAPRQRGLEGARFKQYY